MFLVRREESRSFDMFFGCFWCLEERKTSREVGQEAILQKKWSFSGLRGA